MRDLSPNLLSQPVQGHNVHTPFYGIGRSNEVELSSIIQKAGSQLIVNQGLTPISGAYEPRKSIWVQVGYPLYLAGGSSRLG